MTIRVVGAGGELYVRSYRGRSAGWFSACAESRPGSDLRRRRRCRRRVRRDRQGHDAVDAVYRSKVRGYIDGDVDPIVAPAARSTTGRQPERRRYVDLGDRRTTPSSPRVRPATFSTLTRQVETHTTSRPPRSASPDARVVAWRRAQLRTAGFSPDVDEPIAGDWRYDLHALIELVERGCLPCLAADILAPLEGSFDLDERELRE